MKDREKTILFEMNYCQNYKVKRMDITCLAGEGIRKFEFKNKPCIGGHEKYSDPCKACPSWIRRTREMGEARADRAEKSFNELILLNPVLAEWRKKEPLGKQEIIKCPVCAGKLHLTESSSNSHVHGRCETDDCINFME